MASKLVRLSADNVTYVSLPSNTADLNDESTSVNDTILGNTFESMFTSLVTWNLSADGVYKGVAGYETCLLKAGTPVAATDEAMTLVSGQTYRITDATKNIWSNTAGVTVYDGVTDVTAEVLTFNYLFGTITFDPSYTVVGAVTVDVTYIPVAVFGRFNSFTLTQSVTAVDDSDFQSLKANNGVRLQTQGLRTVSLEATGIYDTSDDFRTDLLAREYFVIEIQADGDGYSKARGYFRVGTIGQSGAAGDNEEQTVNFMLSVPSSDYTPFAWDHSTSSTLNDAIIIALDAFNNETNVYVEYLPEGLGGAGGVTGQGIVTDISLASGVEDMPRFTVSISGDGALTAVV